jgi:thymidylate synthase
MKNGLDEQYIDLLKDILENGVEKNTRNGKVLSVFGRTIRYKFKDGKFPLLTTKKLHFKSIVTELIWFLRGDTHIKFLHDNGCHIWDGDLYKNWRKQFEVDPNNFNGEEVAKGHNDQCWGYPILDHIKPTSKEYKRGQINAYLEGKAEKPFFYLTQEEFINKIKTDDEFARQWGDLGKIYGKQWRSWGRKNVTNYDLENVKSSDKVKVMDLIRDGGDYSKYDVKVTYQNNSIDQISELIKQLKHSPDSRRMVVNAWNASDLPHQVLPPCHYGFQVYTRELKPRQRTEIAQRIGITLSEGSKSSKEWDKECDEKNVPKRAISLMWNQRSCDVPLGIPFNIASYGLLLEIIAKMVNMVPDELIGNLGDCHIYSNQIDGVNEQIGRPYTLEERTEMLKNSMGESEYKNAISHIAAFNSGLSKYYETYKVPIRTREPFELPTLTMSNQINFNEGIDEFLNSCLISDFIIEGYKSYPTIKFPLSN